MRRWNLIALTALCLALTTELAAGQYLETTIQLSYGLVNLVWNPGNNHLYVSNMNDNTVAVIDGATNQVLTSIQVAAEPNCLCLNSTANKVYCTSGGSKYLNVIDAVGDTLVRKVRIRGYPDRMAFCQVLNKLYVICSDDNMVRVYDGATDTLMAEVWFGALNIPYWLVWHPGSNRILCATRSDASSDTVFVIDCQTDLVVRKTAVGDDPHDMCLNPTTGQVYVSSISDVCVLTANGDSVLAAIPQPHNQTAYMCAAPYPSKMYAARGGWLYVIDGDRLVVSESLIVGSGRIICDTDKGKVYGAAEPVPVIDARGDSVLLTISAPGDEWGPIVWNQTESRIYMLSTASDAVLVIRDTTTAVGEPAAGTCHPERLMATVCRGRLRLYGDGPARLLDLSGRQVARLKSGDNNVRHLRTGVYFIRPDKAALSRKVIIQN
jgi:YVTN family beta-propeller protein